MAGLSNSNAFQASLEQKSEFYSGNPLVRTYSYFNESIAANTTVKGLFADLIADPTCKGVAIEKFLVGFTAGEAWSGANNFTIRLVHYNPSGTTIFDFDGGVDASNISSNTVYVDMLDYPVVADTFSELFDADTDTFGLDFIEEGTASMLNVNVYIQYKKVPGTNLYTATEAA